MLNFLWTFMILSGILWAAFNGTLGQVTDEMLAACGEAVTLGITMLGAMCLWTGVLETGKRAGLIERLSKAMRPMFRFLFPLIDPGSEAARQICVNLTANFLGLGQAATPAGLKAMDELKKLEEKRRLGQAPGPVRPSGTASNEMCTFLILNISSLQLIPVSVIAYRSQYGSANPAAIVGAGIVATAVSTGAAVVFCKMMDRWRRAGNGKQGTAR